MFALSTTRLHKAGRRAGPRRTGTLFALSTTRLHKAGRRAGPRRTGTLFALSTTRLHKAGRRAGPRRTGTLFALSTTGMRQLAAHPYAVLAPSADGLRSGRAAASRLADRRAAASRLADRGHDGQREEGQAAHHDERAEDADVVAEQSQHGWSGEEGHVADRRHDGHAGGSALGVVGGGAHTHWEAQCGPDAPDGGPGKRQPRRAEDDERRPDGRQREAHPQHRDPAMAVEETRAEEPPQGHEGEERREPQDACPGGQLVPLDERDGQPVVGRALRERGREDDDADEQGPRLQPRRPVALTGCLGGLPLLGRPGQEAREGPPGETHGDDDGTEEVQHEGDLGPRHRRPDQGRARPCHH